MINWNSFKAIADSDRLDKYWPFIFNEHKERYKKLLNVLDVFIDFYLERNAKSDENSTFYPIVILPCINREEITTLLTEFICIKMLFSQDHRGSSTIRRWMKYTVKQVRSLQEFINNPSTQVGKRKVAALESFLWKERGCDFNVLPSSHCIVGVNKSVSTKLSRTNLLINMLRDKYSPLMPVLLTNDGVGKNTRTEKTGLSHQLFFSCIADRKADKDEIKEKSSLEQLIRSSLDNMFLLFSEREIDSYRKNKLSTYKSRFLRDNLGIRNCFIFILDECHYYSQNRILSKKTDIISRYKDDDVNNVEVTTFSPKELDYIYEESRYVSNFIEVTSDRNYDATTREILINNLDEKLQDYADNINYFDHFIEKNLASLCMDKSLQKDYRLPAVFDGGIGDAIIKDWDSIFEQINIHIRGKKEVAIVLPTFAAAIQGIGDVISKRFPPSISTHFKQPYDLRPRIRGKKYNSISESTIVNFDFVRFSVRYPSFPNNDEYALRQDQSLFNVYTFLDIERERSKYSYLHTQNTILKSSFRKETFGQKDQALPTQRDLGYYESFTPSYHYQTSEPPVTIKTKSGNTRSYPASTKLIYCNNGSSFISRADDLLGECIDGICQLQSVIEYLKRKISTIYDSYSRNANEIEDEIIRRFSIGACDEEQLLLEKKFPLWRLLLIRKANAIGKKELYEDLDSKIPHMVGYQRFLMWINTEEQLGVPNNPEKNRALIVDYLKMGVNYLRLLQVRRRDDTKVTSQINDSVESFIREVIESDFSNLEDTYTASALNTACLCMSNDQSFADIISDLQSFIYKSIETINSQ